MSTSSRSQAMPGQVSIQEMLPSRYQVEPGSVHPIGATPDEQGVNFSLFAYRATAVELLLFEHPEDLKPVQVIQLNTTIHKTFGFWHAYVKGVKPGIGYAYRVDGVNDPYSGNRFNYNKVLVDPYARGYVHTLWNRLDACTLDDNLSTSMRGVVIDTSEYDWEGDQPLMRPMQEAIIYEMHVRGFTQSPTSKCRNPGTFSGIREKIPYLKELGITAIELLPIFDFDYEEVKQTSPAHLPLINYWGYDPISFFALQGHYCISPNIEENIKEFRDLVKALHKEGVEVILDVVFNHTTEGDHRGPVINFKGLANECYYILSQQNKYYYMNFSGCGNTLNPNHPITEKLILDVLNFWVHEMHVDGFRFDEATVLARDEIGQALSHPPVIWRIELSDTLSNTKVIAEAWDAGGLNKVASFPGFRWKVWNGLYRDTIRGFVKSDQAYSNGKTLVGQVAEVVTGTADFFASSGKRPLNSINFVTTHDGFTLNDLVSYNEKHNEANGEGNLDGFDANLSWNCGVEGETEDSVVETLRKQQIKNFAAILLLSQGVPMFVAGDEVRRTQQGNNNAYCQDNEMNWFDWELVEKNQEIFRFFKKMIAFRKAHPILHRSDFFDGRVNGRGLADISWHGCRLNHPGWDNPSSRVLAFTLGAQDEKENANESDIHVMLNMEWDDLAFDIVPIQGRRWYRVIDTTEASPRDIVEPTEETIVSETTCVVKSHSVVVLISR